MDWTLEVVVVPVSDIDRAITFYRDRLGFTLDFDTRTDAARFAQLTPPGSGCSIQVKEPSPMPPGSLRGLLLVVADANHARDALIQRGVAVGAIDVIDERDGGTVFEFAIPTATRGRFSSSRHGPTSRSFRVEAPGQATIPAAEGRSRDRLDRSWVTASSRCGAFPSRRACGP